MVKFSWVDSPLVKAMQNGDWLLVKNVHYCNPAVLDRLNALLETDGELLITEKGSIDGKSASYKPHKDFRLVGTLYTSLKFITVDFDL
uniref:ATPase dynein-related AAA domain-containing protein n=1 Tax=Romanomermis culicivorax TaxID=13658 RepID=A0A915IR34_ROMCU